jgi:hypothetical protein
MVGQHVNVRGMALELPRSIKLSMGNRAAGEAIYVYAGTVTVS